MRQDLYFTEWVCEHCEFLRSAPARTWMYNGKQYRIEELYDAYKEGERNRYVGKQG